MSPLLVERSLDLRLVDVGKLEEPEEDLQESPKTLPHPTKSGSLPRPGRSPGDPPADRGEANQDQSAPTRSDQSLRKILFGGTFHVFDYEWRKSIFQFREPNSEVSYALETNSGGAKAIQTVVQARIIKHLLFLQPSASEGQTLRSLTVGQEEQDRALATALADSLWLAGQEIKATITLVTQEYYITPHLDYKQDNFTERVPERGCRTHYGFSPRPWWFWMCRGPSALSLQALLNLLLTGKASPNVFNGTRSLGEDGRPLECPLQGLLSRGDVGYLHWSREQMGRGRLPQVGSMLKTPQYPVWICCINSRFSVLFGLNRSLLSDWRMEHLFHLFYFSGQTSQTTTAQLTVDTHSHHWEAPFRHSEEKPETRNSSLEMTIRTKWDGADIHWTRPVLY
ncbi:inactive ubiquitin carboxyl-terminal hydrolase MINDY-4B [Spinachia spinachia]